MEERLTGTGRAKSKARPTVTDTEQVVYLRVTPVRTVCPATERYAMV